MAGMNPVRPPLSAGVAVPAAILRTVLAVLWASAAFAQTYYWNPSPAGGGEAQRTQNWTSLPNGNGIHPPSEFDDGFDDDLPGPWIYRTTVPDTTHSKADFSQNQNRLTIQSRGVDVWFNDNQFTALYRTDITGNFDVSVKVVSQTASHIWAKAGILAANNFLSFSSGGLFAVEATPGNGWVEQYDSQGSIGTIDFPSDSTSPRVTYPHWLRMTRVGNVFTAYYRTDSTAAWTKIRESRTPQGAVAGGSSHIGLFVTSHNTAVTCTTVFDDFRAGGTFDTDSLDLSFGGTGASADQDATLGGPLSARSVDFTGYTGAFSFGASSLSLTGDAFFAPTMRILPGTGRLVLSGTSGGQQLTPKAADTLPTIWKTGGSTARILDNPLLADSLHVAAGTFDLNGQNAHLQQFTASGGALTGFADAADTLFVYSRADFAGLQTLQAGAGTVALKAVGNGKIVLFDPAGHAFNHVTLWTVPTGTNRAYVRVGPGDLVASGDLVFRSQRAAARVDGETDFRIHDPDVTVGGNIAQIIEGAAAQANWFPIFMGNGTWKAGGDVAFSLYGGSADSSVLELTRASGIQSLRVTQGSGPNPLNRVVHAAAGTVRLDTVLAADSLAVTGGVLDLNGNDVRLSGSLRVDGPPGLLANLGGRTLTVAGDAVFLGREGAPLALAPAAAWTVNVTGALTADFADIGSSLAAGATGVAGPGTSDRGGNVNWSFGGGPATEAPVIVREPVDVTAIDGEAAAFLVSASGHAPKTYAWRRTGDTAVIGTDSALALPAVTLAMNGFRYRCVVANSSGSATSREARLTVLPQPPPPAIVREPSDTSVKVGTRAAFSAGVTGGAPLRFAWRRTGDTALLSGDSVFVIAAAAADQDGSEFYVIVSNPRGSDTSAPARLSVRLCDSLTMQVSRDTAVAEGRPVVLWGKAGCADRVEWTVVSGPAPRLIDPGVDTLAFPAPRVTRDTAVRYRFTAYSGGEQQSLPVVLRVLEAVPDPDFTLAASLDWNGAAPLVLRPALQNRAILDLAVGYPLRYLWSLEPGAADTSAAGDSLVLRNPTQDGILEASLCLDNGGEPRCDTTRVDVRRLSVSAAAPGIRLAGGLLLTGSRLTWLVAGEARLWDARGRLLYRAAGVPGTRRELPEAARKALGRGARLLFAARNDGRDAALDAGKDAGRTVLPAPEGPQSP